MKLAVALLCLFTCSFIVRSQSIPEGAEGIEVTTTVADSALFESTLTFLEDHGFDVETADEDQGTIATAYTVVQGINLRIVATVENSVVVFKGQGSASSSSTSEPLVYQASASELAKTGFQRLSEVVDRYAKTLDQATVEYLIP
ncbi:hypothetical protein GCM10027341_41160 [Spirosoma knui]